MNVPAALAHLAKVDITPTVLADEGINPADPDALRALVDELLGAALAEDILTDKRQIGHLEAARECLLPDGEQAWRDALAADMRRFLAAKHETADVELACLRAA